MINISTSTSSVTKGETLYDTMKTLEAMHPDVLVIRHPASGAPHWISERLHTSVVNAGDGAHEHPTQALLDAFTIRRHKGKLDGLIVTICGDVAHSRVMVVKDNADGSTDLADRLRAAGCDVLESGSGSHALDLLRTQGDTLSVLVVDRTLPEFVVGELLRTAQVVSAQLEVLVAPLSTGDREVANDTGRECKSAIDDLVQRVLATVIRTNSQ